MKENRIQTVSVIGCGYMGWVFGLHCAIHGYPVNIYDINQEAIDRAKEQISQELDAQKDKRLITPEEKQAILRRISFTQDLQNAVATADFVFETVPEKLELKREIFARLDRFSPAETILATGSSSLPVSRIEDATKRPDRVLNTHFYPPIWEMPMVELMRGTATSEETLDRVRQFMNDIEVVSLMVLKESTGFLFNRIWRAIKKECLTVADTGVATFEDVDRAWSIFMAIFKKFPGPFALMDSIGLDTVLDIEKVYHQKSGNSADAPPKILTDKVENRELGLKTGKGFYTYPRPAFEKDDWLPIGKRAGSED